MPSAMIGNLAVSLTMNTAAFQRGATLAEKRAETMRGRFAAATTSVTGLGKALGAGLAADVLYRITSSAFEMASSLQEAAEQTGVTVEALQELRFAAEQTGVGADKIEAAMKRLSRSLGDLQRGKAGAVNAFREIGLSAEQLRGKRPEEALRIIADALNRLPDASQRVAIGQQIMGRSFSDLLPLINGGSQALDQYAETSRRNGQISTEDAKRLDELADRWGELKTRVGVATAQILSAAAKMSEGIIAAFGAMGVKVDLFDLTLVGMVTSAIGAVNRLATGIGRWIRDALGNIWDAAIAKINTVKAAFLGLYDAVVGHSYVPDMVDGIKAEMARLDAVMVAPVEAATGRASQAFRTMASNVKGLLDRLFPELRAVADFRADEALIGQLPPELRAAADKRLLSEFVTGSPLGAAPLSVSMDSEPLAVPEKLDSVLESIGEKLPTLAGKWDKFGEAAGRAFGELSHQLTGVLLGFQSLGDAIRNVIARLAEMALQAAFKMLGAGLGIPAFAGGTNFAPGGLALVGERGPELVNLPRGSQVIPNHRIGPSAPVFNISVNGAMSDRDARRTGHQIASAASQRMAQARRAGVAG